MTTPMPDLVSSLEAELKQLAQRVSKTDAIAYFNAKETNQFKKSLTGLNHTVDGLKIGLALVTSGVQLVKIDISGLKIDEKGITWLGRTKVTFPSSKGSRRKRREQKAQAEIDKIKSNVAKIRTRLREKAAEERLASFLTKEAANLKYSTKEDVQALKNTLRGAGQAGKTGVNGNQKQQIRDLRTSVNELSEALAGI